MKKNRYLLMSLMMAMLMATLVFSSTVKGEPVASTPEKNLVLIQDYKFQPAVLTIQKGEKVTWKNMDSMGHTVTGDSINFKSKHIGKGETFEYTFNETGLYDYHCSPHPYMTGQIVVQDMPATQALDSEKVVIFVMHAAKKASANDVAMLTAKLASQFKFPKYEILNGAFTEPKSGDRASLEQIAQETGANDVVLLDIKKFSALFRTNNIGMLRRDDEYEDISVSLTLSYLNKKTNQYGQLNGERYTTNIPSPFSGALQVSLSLVEEMLDKLDPVFPRQFPGPRY